MTISSTPTMDELRPVVFRVLSDGRERHIQVLCDEVADVLKLSEEVRDDRISSGEPRYQNRIKWACSMSVKAGLLRRPRTGWYQITDDGLIVDGRNLSKYSEKDMVEWPAWVDFQQEISERRREQTDSSRPTVELDDGVADPIEVMESRRDDFNAKTETDLRKRLQESTPEFFEKAVIELLWAMGYGGSHGEKRHVGRSGDEGIDGIIKQDALGLTNVYIQAKRYADHNRVGEPEVRNFIGSLDARGADRGVFITTSSFSETAVERARNYRHGKIVLIDGVKLTSLMLEHGVAVHKKQEFVLYEIDEDFFEADLG